MTPATIASLLKGRRYAKGKWFARCPAHREKTASLSICDMGGGRTRLHCFGGCDQKAVLDALGLTWQDLTTERQADPAALRAIKLERQRQARADAERKAVYRDLATSALFWERQAAQAGKLMAEDHPKGDILVPLFHEALRKMRILHSALAPLCHPANPPVECVVARRTRRK